MTDQWRPMSARGKADPRFDTLHEGVPEWLRPAIQGWLAPLFWSGNTFRSDLLHRVQLALRRTIPVPLQESDWTIREFLLNAVCNDVNLCFDLLDWLVQQEPIAAEHIERLHTLLLQGGSVWTLETNSKGSYLARRVESPIAEAATRVIEDAPPNAAHHLEAAWRQVYGRSPNPNAGYGEAVKAIEAVVCRVVIPDDASATLGKAIATLRQAPSGKFTVAITGPSDPLAHVRGLCELVWQGQARHGEAGPNAKRDQTQEEAEMALHAALTLVQWFSRGLVRMATGL